MSFHDGLGTMIALAPDEGNAPDHGLSSLAAKVPFRLLRHPSLKVENIDRIFCWLFCKDYDVLDVAATLDKRDFRGTLIALSWKIPKPNMIKSEVKSNYPALSFEIEQLNDALSGNQKYERFIRQTVLELA